MIPVDSNEGKAESTHVLKYQYQALYLQHNIFYIQVQKIIKCWSRILIK